MRKSIGIAVVIAIVVAAWVAWPFQGVQKLGSELADGGSGALLLMDLPSVRRSIVRQLVEEAVVHTKRDGRHAAVAVRLVAGAEAGVFDKRAEEILTLSVLRDLVAEGRLPSTYEGMPIAPIAPWLAGPSPGFTFRAMEDHDRILGVAVDPMGNLQEWSFSGPTTFHAVVGADGAEKDWTGIEMRLDGFRWTMTGIRLSPSVVEAVRPVIRAHTDRIG
jgi:hypothetical protein